MRLWLPVMTLCQRELVRFWREKGRVLGLVASPLVFWLLIGSGYGNLGFFFPGALVLTVMFSAISSTITIIEDRREGFLLSMLVSPAPRSSMVLGKILGSTVLAWLQGIIFLLFAPLVGFRITLASGLGLLGALFLVCFAFTALGFLLAWQMESSQGFHVVMNLLLMPMWMVSGSLFPITNAHAWIRYVMWANPMTYSVVVIRGLLEPQAAAPGPGVTLSVIVTAGFALILWLFSSILATRKTLRSFA